MSFLDRFFAKSAELTERATAAGERFAEKAQQANAAIERARDSVGMGAPRFGKAAPAPVPVHAPEPTPVRRSNAFSSVTFEGGEELTVFTYKRHVFDGMSAGTRFYVDVVPGPAGFMDEDGFPTVFDEDDVILSYGGTVFGVAHNCILCVNELVKAGHSVRLAVVKAGEYDAAHGIPELLATVPPVRMMRAWCDEHACDDVLPPFSETDAEAIIKRRRAAGATRRYGIRIDDIDSAAFVSVNNGMWLDGDWPQQSRDITPRLEVIPTPQGSKAKPHILISDGATPLVELAARSTSYATVAENVARPCRGRVIRGVYDDGIEYLKIVLAFD